MCLGSTATQNPSTGPSLSIAGNVRSYSAQAIPGTHVYLRHGPASSYEYLHKETNVDGSYQFSRLKPGVIIVAAFAKDFSVAGQMRIMKHAGQRANNVDLVLQRPEALHLVIRDEMDNPVADAKLSQIMWKQTAAEPVWLTESFLMRLAHGVPSSNDRGILTVPWIPAGAVCSVRVSHSEFARSETETGPPSTLPNELKLLRGKPLTIRVVDAASGDPATDAVVSITGPPQLAFNLYDQPVNSNAEMTTRIAHARQQISVNVSHPKLAAARTGFLWIDEAKRIEVRLGRRAKLEGRVVDSGGSPVENMTVSVSHRTSGSSFSSRAVTNRDGEFQADAREGQVSVTVRSGGGYAFERKPISIELSAETTERINDLIVERIVPVRGVVRSQSGAPLPYALVSDLTLPYGGKSVLADGAGRFELPLLRPPRAGATHVVARHPTKPLAGGVTVTSEKRNQGESVSLAVSPESTLQGRVVSEGRHAPDVTIIARMLVDLGKRKYMIPVASSVTNSSGVFRFTGLSRHTQYHVLPAGQPLRRVPDDLIDLNAALVEIPDPIEAVSGGAQKEEAKNKQHPPSLACDEWINSSPLRLDQLRGKVVLIDFWATWCGPCVAELPKLELAHKLYADLGLVIIGVHDNSTSSEDVRRFVTQRQLSFPIGVDNSQGNTVGRFEVTLWPTKILIDRAGHVVPLNRDADLFAALRDLLLYESQ